MIDVGALLERVEAAAPIDAVEAVAASLGEMVDAAGGHLPHRRLQRPGRRPADLGRNGSTAPGARASSRRRRCRCAGTVYERVLRTQQADVAHVDDGARLIVPVTDRGDAIGVIEMLAAPLPQPGQVADIRSAAHALAYVVIAARRHTDIFEWGQRSTPFALAAEIQRRLLPASYTCEAGQFTLAGWLEPASSVGGDTFDYTPGPRRTAGVDHRRRRAPGEGGPAGHPPGRQPAQRPAEGPRPRRAGPVRERRAGRERPSGPVRHRSAAADRPAHRHGRRSSTLGTRPRCACATAGWRRSSWPSRRRSVSSPARTSGSSRSPSSPATGSSCSPTACRSATPPSSTSPTALAATAALHPREVVHALGDAVMHATGGDLRDDATMVCIDWYGGPPRRRVTEQGADVDRASSASRAATDP